jgi:uncharacterized Ntn-hydrolase superfamily protein
LIKATRDLNLPQEAISVSYPENLFQTYSIVARDAKTGELGVAVQTHQMCVGAVVPWLAVGQGALATQSLTNVRFGPMGLAMLKAGIPAEQVVAGLIATDEGRDKRQLAVVDRDGHASAWTGENCIAYAGHRTGEGYSVQANMMCKRTVIEAMADAYEEAQGDLAARMLTALGAAQREGGDIRGMQSAALKVVGGAEIAEETDRLIPRYDLRVDEHDDPVAELGRLVRLRRAQLRSGEGFELLKSGETDAALEIWREARELAPELEELAFWQAMALADDGEDIHGAVDLLGTVFRDDPLREQWMDLIERIQDCGIIEREGVAKALMPALQTAWEGGM